VNIEATVYLSRKLHWTHEEIGNLTPARANALLAELLYQESIDTYIQQCAVARILAAIGNTIPRKRGSQPYKPSDFLSMEEPNKDPQPQTTMEEEAEKKGIKFPKE